MTTHNLRSGCSVILSRASMMGFASRHSATSSTLPVLPCSQLWKPVHFLKHSKFNPNISARFCICARSSSCSSFWQCSKHQTRQASLSGEESTGFHAMSAKRIATRIPAASPTVQPRAWKTADKWLQNIRSIMGSPTTLPLSCPL